MACGTVAVYCVPLMLTVRVSFFPVWIVGKTRGTRKLSILARCLPSITRVSGSWMLKSVDVPEMQSRESTKICLIYIKCD